MKHRTAQKAVNPKKLLSDRYEKRSERISQIQSEHDYVSSVKPSEVVEDENLETRSLAAEIDYTKKDATRHIVENEASNRN